MKNAGKLCPKGLAFAGGIIWGVSLFVLTLMAMSEAGYGREFAELIMTVYPGYELSFAGSIIGLVYGFLEGFIGMWIFAWLYNKFADCK